MQRGLRATPGGCGSCGDLQVLQYVRLVGAPWDGSAYWAAANCGHMHVLAFLFEHHCSFANPREGFDGSEQGVKGSEEENSHPQPQVTFTWLEMFVFYNIFASRGISRKSPIMK